MSSCPGDATCVLLGGVGCPEEFLVNPRHYCSSSSYTDASGALVCGQENIWQPHYQKKSLFSSNIHTHTHHPGSSELHSAALTAQQRVSLFMTFKWRNPKISLQTQVVSHLVTVQIRYKSRFPCFLYSHATEAQHLCCVCGKGRPRPAVSLPWQDGLIVIPGSIVCQNSLGQDRGLSCQGSPAETTLPWPTLLPCAPVSSCHPEVWLRPESPVVCTVAAVELRMNLSLAQPWPPKELLLWLDN